MSSTPTFVEVDAPYEGQLMAIGCKPVMRSKIRNHLSSLPLYKRPTFGDFLRE